MGAPNGIPAIYRVLGRVDVANDGCWIFTGAKSSGYGQLGTRGKSQMAHRLSYEHFVGPIPSGHVVHHECRTPACVNPDHLRPLTIGENVNESPKSHASKTHCANGHPYDAANTRIVNGKWRQCRTCGAERKRRARGATV